MSRAVQLSAASNEHYGPPWLADMSLLTQAASIRTDRALIATGRGTLYDFVKMAWQEVEPARFQDSWHIEEVCAHLEAMSYCEIRNLVINEPPGCTKSLIVNVLWPAWEWILRAATKWIFASYDSTLVGRRDGGKLINLLASVWFRSRWGNLLTETNPSASNFDIVGGGFRFSTSPRGKGTGRHGNITVFDDIVKPVNVLGGGTIERAELRMVSDWNANTMSTRQADPATHRNLIIMQRLHNGDLAGEMLRTGDYVHLCFPMRFISDLKCRTKWGGDRRTVEGELLFPSRWPEAEVKRTEAKMGPAVASAQFQQRPDVEGGGIFKRSVWRFWHPQEDYPEPCLCEKCFKRAQIDPAFRDPSHVSGRKSVLLPAAGLDCQSWDMTFKKTADSDYVAAGLWRAYGGRFYLVDVLNERLFFTDAKIRVIQWAAKWPSAYDKLIEDAANGPAIADELKHDIPGITLVKALGGKEARANATSPLYAEEKVFLPHPDICPLIWHYMAQHEAFPKDVNDDLVDQASQALLRLRQYGDAFSAAMAKIRGDK